MIYKVKLNFYLQKLIIINNVSLRYMMYDRKLRIWNKMMSVNVNKVTANIDFNQYVAKITLGIHRR